MLEGLREYTSKVTGKTYKVQLSKAEFNEYLRQNPAVTNGVSVIRMDGAGEFDKFDLAMEGLPNGLWTSWVSVWAHWLNRNKALPMRWMSCSHGLGGENDGVAAQVNNAQLLTVHVIFFL